MRSVLCEDSGQTGTSPRPRPRVPSTERSSAKARQELGAAAGVGAESAHRWPEAPHQLTSPGARWTRSCHRARGTWEKGDRANSEPATCAQGHP